MQQIPEVYTKEFREQAVRLVLEEGLSIPQAGSGCRCRPRPWPTGWEQHAAVNWRPWAVSGRCC